MSLVLLQAPRLHGQDDWDANEKGANEAEEEMRVRAGGIIQESDFNQWIYGDRDSTQFLQKTDTLLTLHLESVERACPLSDTQKKKLRLAGHGEVARVVRSVEELKQKCVGSDHQAMAPLWQELHTLRTTINSGLFGNISLFRKTLAQTLTPQQATEYDRQDRERQRFWYEAKIERVLSKLENGLPLREEQRQRIVTLLLEETEPPKQFGEQDLYVVLYQAGQIGDEKLKPIFDEAQWPAVQQLLRQGRSMEQYLKSNGFVP